MWGEADFWDLIDRFVTESRIVIGRPKGTRHPSYPEVVYPADYGYLENTRSMDGEGIDVWVGSSGKKQADTIICTVDMKKRDAEIKILIGCSEEEKEAILQLLKAFSTISHARAAWLLISAKKPTF